MKKLLSRLLIFNPQFSIFQNGFIQHQLRRSGAGFTLIELIVVIAILGILAVVLITIIDPLDKINAANDAGVISSIAQFGKANDSYAATHNNSYVGTPAYNNNWQARFYLVALPHLLTAGEIRTSLSYDPTSGYTLNYTSTKADGTGCATADADCTIYVFWVTPLKSKKNVNGTPPDSGPQYVYANGKGCFKAAGAITFATTCP